MANVSWNGSANDTTPRPFGNDGELAIAELITVSASPRAAMSTAVSRSSTSIAGSIERPATCARSASCRRVGSRTPCVANASTSGTDATCSMVAGCFTRRSRALA